MIEETLTTKLLQLRNIFKDGFTIKYNNGNISQYNNYKYLYIVSYKTVIIVNTHEITFNVHNIPNKCIIGGWFDIESNKYYIELNYAFDNLKIAKQIGKQYNQKYVYDLKKDRCIKI